MKTQIRIFVLLTFAVCDSCIEWGKDKTPICPADVVTPKITQSSIKLEWKGVGKIQGYRIYRDGKKIADLPPAATSYVDENLKSKTMYIYNVKPYITGHEGDCFGTGAITL